MAGQEIKTKQEAADTHIYIYIYYVMRNTRVLYANPSLRDVRVVVIVSHKKQAAS